MLWCGTSAWAQAPVKGAAQNAVPAGDPNADFEFDRNALVIFDEAATQTALESLVMKKIDALDRRYHLTAEQKHRLRLAGEGDIGRLFDRFRAARQEFGVAWQRQNEKGLQSGRAAAATLNFEFPGRTV